MLYLEAGGVNAREALLEAFAVQVGEVKIDNRLARRGNLQARGQWRERRHRAAPAPHLVVLGHEAAETGVAQVSALAAQRLGEQKARRTL